MKNYFRLMFWAWGVVVLSAFINPVSMRFNYEVWEMGLIILGVAYVQWVVEYTYERL